MLLKPVAANKLSGGDYDTRWSWLIEKRHYGVFAFILYVIKVTRWLKKDVLLFNYDNENKKKYTKFLIIIQKVSRIISQHLSFKIHLEITNVPKHVRLDIDLSITRLSVVTEVLTHREKNSNLNIVDVCKKEYTFSDSAT